jgi:hypothetical protein
VSQGKCVARLAARELATERLGATAEDVIDGADAMSAPRHSSIMAAPPRPVMSPSSGPGSDPRVGEVR